MRFLFAFIFILSLVAAQLNGQPFEGIITYKTKIIPKVRGLDTAKIYAEWPGDSSHYYITEGRYKNVFYKNGKEFYTYTFNYEDYKMYDDVEGQKIMAWRDASKGTESSEKLFSTNDTLINGQRCGKIIAKSKNYTSITYFSKELKFDTIYFTNHKVGDWGETVKLSNGGINMLSIISYPQYYHVNYASKIVDKKLFKEDFKVKEKIIAPAIQALDSEIKMVSKREKTDKCIYTNLKVPENKLPELLKYKEYVVGIKFLINENGQVELSEVDNNDEFGFGEEALRVFNKCSGTLKFEKPTLKGMKVKAVYYYPVWFTIQ